MTVDLTEQEWVLLLNSAALAPYAQIATVIAKVAEQLQVKQVTPTGLQTQPVKQES